MKSWLDPRGTCVKELQVYPDCALGARRTGQVPSAWDSSSWVFAAGGNNDVALWDMKTSQMVSLFVGTPQPQDIDQGMLQSSLDVVNAKGATDVKSIRAPRTATQIFEQERLAKQADGSIKHQRLLWSQLKPADQQQYIGYEKHDVVRYEDELTQVLSGRWCGHSLRTHTPGMRVVHTHPRVSAVFMGSSDGHIRIWDLDRPHASYLLGETPRAPAAGGGRADFATTYEIEVQSNNIQILKERLGHETRSKAASVPTASRGPIAPVSHHLVGINSLAVVSSPKFLLSASSDGVIKVWK